MSFWCSRLPAKKDLCLGNEWGLGPRRWAITPQGHGGLCSAKRRHSPLILGPACAREGVLGPRRSCGSARISPQEPKPGVWSSLRGSCSSFLRALVWMVELETLLVCAGRHLLCVPYFNPKRTSSKSRTRKTLSYIVPTGLCGVTCSCCPNPLKC